MNLVLVMLVAVLLYSLQNRIYKKRWNSGLKTSISFGRDHVTCGDSLSLTETVINEKRLPLARLEVKFMADQSFEFEDQENSNTTDHYYRNDVFTLLPFQQTKRSLRFRCGKRGLYSISSLDLISGDLFFRHSYAMRADNAASVYVYPNLIKNLESALLKARHSGEHVNICSLFTDPYMIRGLREYSFGDDVRRINWMKSAAGPILINEFDPVSQRDITVVLNLRTFYENDRDIMQEYMISMAATVVKHFTDQGCRISFITNGRDVLSGNVENFGVISGSFHLDAFFRGLSRLDTSKEPESLENVTAPLHQSTDERTYILISNDRTEALQKRVLSFMKKNSDFMWILPEFSGRSTMVNGREVNVPGLVRWEVPK